MDRRRVGRDSVFGAFDRAGALESAAGRGDARRIAHGQRRRQHDRVRVPADRRIREGGAGRPPPQPLAAGERPSLSSPSLARRTRAANEPSSTPLATITPMHRVRTLNRRQAFRQHRLYDGRHALPLRVHTRGPASVDLTLNFRCTDGRGCCACEAPVIGLHCTVLGDHGLNCQHATLVWLKLPSSLSRHSRHSGGRPSRRFGGSARASGLAVVHPRHEPADGLTMQAARSGRSRFAATRGAAIGATSAGAAHAK